MMLSEPSYWRSEVVRRLSRSIVPETVSVSVVRSTMSPTSYCASRKMNIPLIVSFTRVCAPNPSATPMIPADAISGAMLTPNASISTRRKTNHATTRAVVATIPTTVAVRRSRRPMPSSPAAFARLRRRPDQRRPAIVTTIAISSVRPRPHALIGPPGAVERGDRHPGDPSSGDGAQPADGISTTP